MWTFRRLAVALWVASAVMWSTGGCPTESDLAADSNAPVTDDNDSDDGDANPPAADGSSGGGQAKTGAVWWDAGARVYRSADGKQWWDAAAEVWRAEGYWYDAEHEAWVAGVPDHASPPPGPPLEPMPDETWGVDYVHDGEADWGDPSAWYEVDDWQWNAAGVSQEQVDLLASNGVDPLLFAWWLAGGDRQLDQYAAQWGTATAVPDAVYLSAYGAAVESLTSEFGLFTPFDSGGITSLRFLTQFSPEDFVPATRSGGALNTPIMSMLYHNWIRTDYTGGI